jgi:hypothetical protein
MDTAAVDVWTAVHHLFGAYFCSVCRASLPATIAAAVAWELFENSRWGGAAWDAVGVPGYNGDTLRNSVTDVVFTVGGWYAARR